MVRSRGSNPCACCHVFQFKCPECHLVYKRKYYLALHLRAAHKKCGGYKCPHCGTNDFNTARE